MIHAERLTKRYGAITAVQDVSFEVRRGEVLGFLGPNGAGKTTTMRILTGFIPATAGTATVAGCDIFEQSLEVRRRIGYLPEQPPLYPEMTVTEYLRFVAGIKGIERRRSAAAVGRMLERCAIGEVRARLLGNLSRGYRQRVGLAQALIHDPEVLILDEPTGGLDPKQIIEIRRLIKALAGERTVILSSHILPEVTATCSRVVIIHQGRVVAEDTPEGLSARLRRSDTIRLAVRTPSPALEEQIRAIPGVLGLQREDDAPTGATYTVECQVEADVREALARAAVESGAGLLELRRVALTLEEVFIQLTTTEPS